MNIGEAMTALKEGKAVARSSWSGWKSRAFLYMQIPNFVDKEMIMKMKSIPETIKPMLLSRNFADSANPVYYDGINFRHQIVIVYPNNLIANWHPGNEDLLAEDWNEVK